LRRLAVVILVVIGLVVASTYIHLPYDAISPGSATPVNDYIVAPKGSAFPPKGKVLLLTVSFREEISPLDYLVSSIDGDTQVISKKDINAGVPKGQNLTQYNRQLMDDSEQAAVVVALRKLGYPVTETGDGAFVLQVTKAGPSANHLTAGDTITSVGGLPVHTLEEATTTIRSHKPGDAVPVTVHPGRGPDRTEQLIVGHRVTTDGRPTCTTSPDPAAQAADACLGVVIQTRNQNFQLPVKVKIDAGNIGGPSAGLSFTLGVIDQLTPGELTGGQEVAVTGTIELDGSVGPVGGVKQKTAAALAAGARYFLVPPDEYNEAVARAKGHNLTVLKVSTLDEALATLGRLGGDVSVVSARPASGQ
jgi:PDZ domain-containing protein